MELQRRIEELVRERDACVPMQGVWCRRPPVRRRHPTNAKRSPRAARVAQRTKLRIAQCFGVWRHDLAKLGELVGQGTSAMGSFPATGSLDGIDSDVGSDRSGRSEETLPCSWIRCTVSHLVFKISQVRVTWCSHRRGFESGPSPSQTTFQWRWGGECALQFGVRIDHVRVRWGTVGATCGWSLRRPQDSRHSTTNSACHSGIWRQSRGTHVPWFHQCWISMQSKWRLQPMMQGELRSELMMSEGGHQLLWTRHWLILTQRVQWVCHKLRQLRAIDMKTICLLIKVKIRERCPCAFTVPTGQPWEWHWLRQFLKPIFREREGGSCSCSCPACYCRDHLVKDCSAKRSCASDLRCLPVAGGRNFWETVRHKKQQQPLWDVVAGGGQTTLRIKALGLVQMGELSAGRAALEAAELAPGTNATLQQLQGLVRQPHRAREPIPDHLLTEMPVPNSIWKSTSFSRICDLQGKVWHPALLGWPANTSDLCWRTPAILTVSSRWLSNSHRGWHQRLQSMLCEWDVWQFCGSQTEVFAQIPVRSVNSGWLRVQLPCASGSNRVGCLPSSPAFCQTIVWQPFPLPLGRWWRCCPWDWPGRRRGAGRPMPLLLSLWQHAALRAVQRQLLPGELVFAYSDDIYVISTQDRFLAVYNLLQAELWRHARIRVHDGKTQMWNKSGARPRGCDTIDRAARATNPEFTTVWRGSALPTDCQGSRSWVVLWAMIILFALIIKLTRRCSGASPESPTSNQRGHCSRIVPVRIIHCGWWGQSWLLNLPAAHDASLWSCLCDIVNVAPRTRCCHASSLWADWVSAVRHAPAHLRVGQAGRIHCTWSANGPWGCGPICSRSGSWCSDSRFGICSGRGETSSWGWGVCAALDRAVSGKWKTSNLAGVGGGSTRQLHGWNVNIVKMSSCPYWMSPQALCWDHKADPQLEQHCRPLLQTLPLASSLALASSSCLTHLPMRPSSWLLWPPSRSVQSSRSVGEARVCSGECGCTDFPRSWCTSCHQCACAWSGPLGAERLRREALGDCGWRLATVRWVLIGGGYHSGQSIETRRVTPSQNCRERRCGSPGCQAPQGAHIPRVGGATSASSVGRLGWRSWWAVVWWNVDLLATVGRSSSCWGVETPLDAHVVLCCRKSFCGLFVGASPQWRGRWWGSSGLWRGTGVPTCRAWPDLRLPAQVRWWSALALRVSEFFL